MSSILAEALVWLLTGFVAGLLDYSLAAGFGLAASVVLVAMLGYEPRTVVGAAAAAQAATATASLAVHVYIGNTSLDRAQLERLAVVAAASTASGLAVSAMASTLSRNSMEALYTLGLVVLAATLLMPPWRSRAAAILYAALAGVFKSIIGGGYGALAARAQMLLGADARSALAAAAAVKIPLFTVVALAYSEYYGLTQAALLALGGLASTPIAAQLLRRMREDVAAKTSSAVALAGVAAKLLT